MTPDEVYAKVMAMSEDELSLKVQGLRHMTAEERYWSAPDPVHKISEDGHFGNLGPLAITRAWVWWKMCKEAEDAE